MITGCRLTVRIHSLISLERQGSITYKSMQLWKAPFPDDNDTFLFRKETEKEDLHVLGISSAESAFQSDDVVVRDNK